MTTRPAEVGRLCGFDRLRDEPHGRWIRQMIGGRGDLTILAHRGSYKTTCLTVAIAILLCLYPEKNILFVRKTQEDAEEVLRQVRALVTRPEMRELTRAVWGRPAGIRRGTASSLTTTLRTGPAGAPQLLARGVGGTVTGRHADLIFTDDIVNTRDRTSAAEREATRAYYMELQNVRNPGGRILNTGTPWHPDDAVSLMPAPEKWDCRRTGLLTEDQIETLRRSMSPSLFAANYELRHIAESGALFGTPPAFTDDAELLRDGAAHLDASYGGEDFTALTLGRLTPDGAVLYGRLWHAHAGLLIDEAARECRRLACAPIYLETNGDKGFLLRELRRRGLPAVGYCERTNKFEKIGTYLHKWWPTLRFLRGTDPAYIDQIADYTCHARHDDAPDSAASLLRVLDRHAAPPD